MLIPLISVAFYNAQTAWFLISEATIAKSFLFFHTEQKITRELETQPATGHARCNFQQIRGYALVESPKTFLGHDHPDSVPNRLVLISHSRHCINLKSPSEDITSCRDSQYKRNTDNRIRGGLQGICACLSYCSRNSTGSQLSNRIWVLLPSRSEINTNGFIDHEIQPNL